MKIEIWSDEETASKHKIRGVLHFVFNDKYTVSGAQAPEKFLEVMRKMED